MCPCAYACVLRRLETHLQLLQQGFVFEQTEKKLVVEIESEGEHQRVDAGGDVRQHRRPECAFRRNIGKVAVPVLDNELDRGEIGACL